MSIIKVFVWSGNEYQEQLLNTRYIKRAFMRGGNDLIVVVDGHGEMNLGKETLASFNAKVGDRR